MLRPTTLLKKRLWQRLRCFYVNFAKPLRAPFLQNTSGRLLPCLLPLTEKGKKSTDSGETYDNLLTDLTKVFGCLPLYFMIANLHTYGLDMSSLRVTCSYPNERKQKGYNI